MKMKKIISCLVATLGIASACGHHAYENADINSFQQLTSSPDVTILDVRTAEEYAQGHLSRAINIDVKQDNFLQEATDRLPLGQTIAVYCRSGRRSADAAKQLVQQGFTVVNLKGGIEAWQASQLPITTLPYEVDLFKTPNGKVVKFHALMHASIRLEYDGKEIEIDPVLQLGERKVDFAAMPKADIVFVTHEHPDHFDKAAIMQTSTDSTLFVTNKRCSDMAGYGTALANGDKLQIADDITVEAVPAYNTTEENLKFHPKGRDNGYVLTLDGLRIYIAGDTEDIPEMAALADIDIAFLPCNQPFTMKPEQLVNAARMVKPKVLFPYHYGQTDVSGIPAQLTEDGIEVRIRHYE